MCLRSYKIRKQDKYADKSLIIYIPVSWVTCNFIINLNSALTIDTVKQFESVKWKNRVFCLFRKRLAKTVRKKRCKRCAVDSN